MRFFNKTLRFFEPDAGATGSGEGADPEPQSGASGGEPQTVEWQAPKSEAELKSLLQSEGDKRVSEAEKKIRERVEAEIRQKMETKALQEKEEYKQLYEQQLKEIEAEKLKSGTIENLGADLAAFAPIFSGDLSTIDGRRAAIEHLRSTLTERDKAVLANSQNSGTAPPKAGGTSIRDVPLSQLDIDTKEGLDEYKRRKAQGA